MYLASIYLENHNLFDKPQTINFGGRFIYDFSNILGITRKQNKSFIENFYSVDNLELVSAIVGKNGTGKTTLLRDLIDFLKGKGYGYNFILFLEKGSSTYTVSSSMVFGCDFIESSIDLSFDTLYYSPYLDFKEPLNGIDLSYDTILEEDFEASKGKFLGSEDINPKRWLKSQNSLRILEFQSSEYALGLKSFFDFPEIERSRISFIRYKIDVDNSNDKIQFHNTPMDLQYSLQPLYNLISKERTTINQNRYEGYSLVELQKNLFKNNLIMDVICMLIKQMEKTNQYLQEGFLEINSKEFNELIENLDSREALFKFLELHYFKIGVNKSQILPIEETKDMVNYLFDLIDNLEAENDRDTRNFDWSYKSIYLNLEQTRRLIEYHTRFLNKVDQYYGGIEDTNGKVLFKKSERIEGLVNYEPSERDLSSGETALLNFYSRIYYYFKKQLIDLESIEKKDFYIILLDEADMGYHPKWKKSFVKSIVSFLPKFFKTLEADIQIIFTTHDPLTLSDIPKNNVTYLSKKDSGETYILNTDEVCHKKTFGANIHDLLADSFFLEDGFMGEFAEEVITDLVNYLTFDVEEEISAENVKNIKEWNEKKAKKLIGIIDEPLIKERVQSLFNKKFLYNDKDLLRLKIKELEGQLKKISNEED
ncbi:AAA family ATPase [Winogradskyella eckloniae]|uniref:AAA family ATPase n=1 Tax=Winogradskyella eckloniae TaxID=1089306 RepID=UPI00156624DF|nr:AAA family ATPase [Winogradskyella eckloniae]NRD19517.1 AAA family ATPase [Winogradskyella eckloniae]